MQQFRLWRDFGGSGVSGFHLFRWNELTGERRSAYINHMIIGALEFLGFLVAFAVLAFAGIVTSRAYVLLFAVLLAVMAVHGIVMLIRRETYWQLVWREAQATKSNSSENLQELMGYAEKVQKDDAK